MLGSGGKKQIPLERGEIRVQNGARRRKEKNRGAESSEKDICTTQVIDEQSKNCRRWKEGLFEGYVCCQSGSQ